MTISIRIRYFAVVRQELGMDQETVELPDGSTVGDLVTHLEQLHEPLKQLKRHLRIALNLAFVDNSKGLTDGDEVAFIPPVAGGAPRISLADAPIDPARIIARVQRDDCGAVVTFIGIVRNHAHGKSVTQLEYETYSEMALAKMEEIAQEIDARWPGVRVAVEHRHGLLTVGEVAIVIAVAAAHRGDAFQACQHMIDRIKQDVPIWKRETGPDGSSWVSEGM